MTPSPSVSFPALGSTAFVAVAEPDRLVAARRAVERVVADFDDACSRFRPDSELSRVNAGAGTDVAVSALLLEAVGAAVRAAELTDGDVDPTIGKALVALGYDRDFDELGEPPVARRSMSIAAVPGWRTIRIDRERATLRVPRGVALDLGATAKALAADRAAADASAAADCGALVGLGGDFAAAGEAPEGGWPVRVADDHRAGVQTPGQWIWLRTGGLATSSTTVRRWQAGRSEPHHLVDPATGTPAAIVWRTASVTAVSCLDANIASTAAIIRGEPAVAWLSGLGLPSRLVRADGAVVHVAGWPADGDDLAPSLTASVGVSA